MNDDVDCRNISATSHLPASTHRAHRPDRQLTGSQSIDRSSTGAEKPVSSLRRQCNVASTSGTHSRPMQQVGLQSARRPQPHPASAITLTHRRAALQRLRPDALQQVTVTIIECEVRRSFRHVQRMRGSAPPGHESGLAWFELQAGLSYGCRRGSVLPGPLQSNSSARARWSLACCCLSLGF